MRRLSVCPSSAAPPFAAFTAPAVSFTRLLSAFLFAWVVFTVRGERRSKTDTVALAAFRDACNDDEEEEANRGVSPVRCAGGGGGVFTKTEAEAEAAETVAGGGDLAEAKGEGPKLW